MTAAKWTACLRNKDNLDALDYLEFLEHLGNLVNLAKKTRNAPSPIISTPL